MKKLALTMLTLLTYQAAEALPVGNPAEASLFVQSAWWGSYGPCSPCDPCFRWCDAWSLRVGYYGDFNYNRHLRVRNGTALISSGRVINKTEIFTNAGYLAFNVCDSVDIFGTVGTSSIRISTPIASFGAHIFPSSLAEVDMRSNLSWSVGIRGTLWECDCFAVGIEGQYAQANLKLDSLREFEFTNYFNESNSARYQDWQLGAGISYRFATNCPSIAMIPYAAVTWSGARLGLDNSVFTDPVFGSLTLPSLRNQKLWGYALGISLTLCDVVGVTVEGRFASEKALSVNGQFRF